MNILEMTDDQIVEELACGSDAARYTLLQMQELMTTEAFRILAIDMEDMRLLGPLIFYAFAKWSKRDHSDFVRAVTARDEYMVAMLKKQFPDSEIRQHGEQQRVKPLDAAVSGLLKTAEEEGKLQRLDDGAEYVHNFFLSMLTLMQKERKFVSNFKLNLAGIADKPAWAVFAVHLVELQDADGVPLKPAEQPQNEANPFPKPANTIDDKAGTL